MIFEKSTIKIDTLTRTFSYGIPLNVTTNYKLAIFLHGSGGSSTSLLDPLTSTYKFAMDLVNNGFIVVAPDARSDFGVSPFKPRWESENNSNPDIKLITTLCTTAIDDFNGNNSIKIDKNNIFIIGGSSGGVMASRMALIPGAETILNGIVLMNACDANSVRCENGHLEFNLKNCIIPINHPRTLLVNSSIDSIIPIEAKIEQYSHLFKSIGDKCEYIWNNTSDGFHNWSTWTEQYHQNIINWMMK